MSIYATRLAIDDDSHEPTCARWRETTGEEARAQGRWLLTFDGHYYVPVPDADCTCGEKAPIIYHGSHVSPSDTDQRGGAVYVCAIPDHCHPQANPMDEATWQPVDFLRLSVEQHPHTYGHGDSFGDATVVLDRKQTQELYETLGTWLQERTRA